MVQPNDLYKHDYDLDELERVRHKHFNTALRAIRQKCLDCCCGSAHEVKLCTIPHCPLYEYRFGKLPEWKKRKVTDAQRQAAREQLAKMRNG